MRSANQASKNLPAFTVESVKHEYDDIDIGIVWETVKHKHLPLLVNSQENVLGTH